MKHTFFLISFLFSSMLLFSQDTTKITTDTNTYSITTFSGKSYIGKILSDDGKEMLIITKKVGKIFLSKEDVKAITLITSEKDIVDGEYVGGVHQFTTRYIFSTNALPIKKGKNYALLNLFGPEVHFAVTDRLGVGIMTTWIASPMALALKYTFKKEKEEANPLWNYSIGTILGTSGYIGNFGYNMGLHFLSATYGNRNNNLTFSGGWSYNNFLQDVNYYKPGVYGYDPTDGFFGVGSTGPDVSLKRPMSSGPAFGASGIIKVGKYASFIMDNLLFVNNRSRSDVTFDQATSNYTVTNSKSPSVTSTTMLGMRFENPNKTAFQVAVAIVHLNDRDSDIEELGSLTFPLPMVSWFKKF